MRYIIAILLLVTSIVFSNPSSSKDRCDIGDFKDQTQIESHQQLYLSLLFTSDESNFKAREKSLSLGGKAILGTVPVSAFSNYASFDNWRSEVRKSLKYVRTEQEDISYLETRLTPDGASSYRECLHSYQAMSVTAIDQRQNDVTFLIEWIPPPLVEVDAISVVHSDVASPLDEPENGGFKYTPVSQKQVTFTLVPNTPFHMQVETVPPGYSAAIHYLISKYKPCRVPQNGIESISRETVSEYKPNADGRDFARDELLLRATSKLKELGHRDVTLVGERYYREQEHGHRS